MMMSNIFVYTNEFENINASLNADNMYAINDFKNKTINRLKINDGMDSDYMDNGIKFSYAVLDPRTKQVIGANFALTTSDKKNLKLNTIKTQIKLINKKIQDKKQGFLFLHVNKKGNLEVLQVSSEQYCKIMNCKITIKFLIRLPKGRF